MSRRVNMVDCTLREGDQTAGVAMTADEKLRLALQLDAAGVSLADAGMPSVHPEEAKFLRKASEECRRMTVGASVRCRPDMVRQAIDCGVGAVFVICPISQRHLRDRLGIEREALLESLAACAEALGSDATLEVVAEDATRAEADDLRALVECARTAGAQRMYLADTVGSQSPGQWIALVRRVQEWLQGDVELGVHCHNDFGMATALTVAAIEAGVRWPTATVNGLGERAGNADLGSVAAACDNLLQLDSGMKLSDLPSLSAAVERASGVPVAAGHPLVGANAFRHESGIHVHGVLADPSMYEAISPDAVGRERTLLIGKHSGRAHLSAVLSSEGLSIDNAALTELRKRIQAAVLDGNRDGIDRLLDLTHEVRRTTQGVPVERVVEWARELGAQS